MSTESASRHRWITGERQADRLAAAERQGLPPLLVPPVSAHRRLAGPYTAAATILAALVPDAVRSVPELVARHEIEILSLAPDLRGSIPASLETLTSTAVPDERTRLYSGLRSLRLAHGLAEFLRDLVRLTGTGPRALVVDDVQEADRTDQELLAVLLRRLDSRELTVVVGSRPDFVAEAVGTRAPVSGPADEADRPPLGGLGSALARWADRVTVEAPQAPGPVGDGEELAERYVADDCISDDPALIAAYQQLPVPERRRLHDHRAAELVADGRFSAGLGAIPFHLARGTAAVTEVATAIGKAVQHFVDSGFYEAAIAYCEWGRELVNWEEHGELRWFFSAKLFTALSAVARSDEAEAICDEARANSTDPLVHRQLAYATAMIYTRHLRPERRDHHRAMGWINEAIAISSLFTDRRKRAFGVVFNSNGRALIEAHMGKPEAALKLVTDGLAMLDEVLEPGEHLLHRSVLRYNRAQTLVMLKRLDEAVLDYQAVLDQDPYYPEYHFELGNVLHRLGREDEAIAEYDAAARLGPPFPELFYNRADVLAGLGRYDEAIDGFGYVLELEPDYLDAYINRAGMLADLGESDRAAEDVRRGLELAPSNAHLLALRGRLELEAERPDSAREALDAAIEADPELAGAWALRGELNFSIGALTEALADLDRAAELDPDPTVLFNRASAARALGRWADAERGFSALLEQDPAESDGWLGRAECRRELGNLAGARADAEAFQRLAPERAAEVAALLADENLVGADG